MPPYLNAEFFCKIKKEIADYANNYELLSERNDLVEKQESLIQENSEECTQIFERIGAIR